VEAAENVVLAYDMNMGEPHAMDQALVDEEMKGLELASPQPITSGDTTPSRRGRKRVRSIDDRACDHSSKTPRLEADRVETRHRSSSPRLGASTDGTLLENIPSLAMTVIGQLPTGVGQTNVRTSILNIVTDVIKGGRVESAIPTPIDGGEEIEVRQRIFNSQETTKLVRWHVDADVPEVIDQNQRDIHAIISRILQNGFKFTDDGVVELTVQLIRNGHAILVTVSDTGIGIPAAFMPRLFKAFSREDDGISTRREGLGLGLMVAKGMVRRLNGDIRAVRSSTEGPQRGTVFEIRIPIRPGDPISRPASPGGSWTLDIDVCPRSFTPSHRRAFSSPPGAGDTTPAGDPTTALKALQSASTSMELDHAPAPPQTPLRPQPPAIPPCNYAFEMTDPDPPPPPPETLAARLPLCILVVEDNSILRSLLVRTLQRMGYWRVMQAVDGAMAVKMMARHRRLRRRGAIGFDVDLVLMDLWMPFMNGYDAAGRIWDLARGLDIGVEFDKDDEGDQGLVPIGGGAVVYSAVRPVILAVTADSTTEAEVRIERAGMVGPLTKPYNRRDLERYLLNYCPPERQ
jgi:CheY-like chemotaxis protein